MHVEAKVGKKEMDAALGLMDQMTHTEQKLLTERAQKNVEVHFNPALEKAYLSTYGIQVKVGMSMADRMPSEEDRHQWTTEYSRTLAGEFVHTEKTVRRGDIERTYLVSYSPIRAGADAQITGLASLGRDISERKKTERLIQEQAEQMRALSLVDELTQLNNRRGFLTLAEHELRSATRNKTPLAILFIDLDGLKRINDNLGHEAGDSAIKAAAQVMRAAFREIDIIARLGGDEFAVLLANCDNAEPPLRRLQAEIARVNTSAQQPFALAMSTGTAIFNAHSPSSLEALLQRADEAMYQNKIARRAQRSA